MNSRVWATSSLLPTLGCRQACVMTPIHLCSDHNATSHPEWQWQSSFTLYVPVTGTGDHPFPLSGFTPCVRQSSEGPCLPLPGAFWDSCPQVVLPIDALSNLNQCDNTMLSPARTVSHVGWRWVRWITLLIPLLSYPSFWGQCVQSRGWVNTEKTSHPRNAVITAQSVSRRLCCPVSIQ